MAGPPGTRVCEPMTAMALLEDRGTVKTMPSDEIAGPPGCSSCDVTTDGTAMDVWMVPTTGAGFDAGAGAAGVELETGAAGESGVGDWTTSGSGV